MLQYLVATVMNKLARVKHNNKTPICASFVIQSILNRRVSRVLGTSAGTKIVDTKG